MTANSGFGVPELVYEFRHSHRKPVSNCYMLQDRLEQLETENRLELLQQDQDQLLFLVREYGYDSFYFLTEPGVKLTLPALERPVMAEVLTLETKYERGLPECRLLQEADFGLHAHCRQYLHSFTADESAQQYLEKRDACAKDFRFRDARPEEAEAIMQLWLSCLTVYDFHNLSLEQLRADILAGYVQAICTPEGQLCGAMLVDQQGTRCSSRHSCVDAAFRGRKLGKAANLHRAAWALTHGCIQFDGWISDTNYSSVGAVREILNPGKKLLLQYIHD